MAKVDFKLNLKGLNELMKSSGIQGVLDKNAASIAQTASSMSGEEYDTASRTLNWIGVATVYPGSAEAARDNYENNTLLKALGSSGLPRSK